jgi:SNF2 family DNA or RNA helicase
MTELVGPLNFELDPYQRTTVDFAKKAHYAILALEQGLGKGLCSYMVAHETNGPLLLICPAYASIKLKNEYKKFFPNKIVTHFAKRKDLYKVWDSDIVIISYSLLKDSEFLFEWIAENEGTVAFDEAQYLKNTDAGRTDYAHKYIYENSLGRVLFLTGTPIENRVYEFYSMIAMCNYDPRIEKSEFLDTFPTYVDFANHFSYLKEVDVRVKTKKGGFKEVKIKQWHGLKNVEELHKWLKPHYIRFELKDVLDLAEPIHIEVPVMYEDNPALMEAFENFTKTGELTGIGSEVKVAAAMATAPFTAQYALDLLDQGLKTIVYTDHPDAAKIIADKLGVKYIDGTMPMELRQKIADQFQAGEIDRIVATMGSFSTCIDLYNGQDTVFNDLPFKPSTLDQSMSRTRRRGQLKVCRYHYIYGTVQGEKIRAKLSEKREVIKGALNVKRED